MRVVDCFTTDLLCMRLCSELSQAESNPRHCKAEVGLSIWSSYLSPEQRVPADHPLRTIRTMTDDALRRLSPRFDAIYATTGRPSIPPEHLLRALLLQVLYSVRSERMLM